MSWLEVQTDINNAVNYIMNVNYLFEMEKWFDHLISSCRKFNDNLANELEPFWSEAYEIMLAEKAKTTPDRDYWGDVMNDVKTLNDHKAILRRYFQKVLLDKIRRKLNEYGL